MEEIKRISEELSEEAYQLDQQGYSFENLNRLISELETAVEKEKV